MTAIVVQADARVLPLPDASVDLIVTSPPYFALRSYTDGGEHYEGQIGSEATPAEYIAALIACTREWMRVLKLGGSIFVNLGDKYAQGSERSRNGHGGRLHGTNPLRTGPVYSGRRDNGAPRKSLLLLPERYRVACVDELGLIVRAVIVWDKLNALPESVTDRVRRSHEDWVHLTKGPRYFASVDEIREDHARSWTPGRNGGTRPALAGSGSQYDGLVTSAPHALGKLPGSVWAIASEPLKVPAELGVDHFAAFPMEWPRRLIKGWSPSGYCTECNEPRLPAYARDFAIQDDCSQDTAFKRDKHYAGNNWHDKPRGTSLVSRTGEACACPDTSAPTRPAVVLDPFGGTGTTALVASAHGRIGITVDRSADYCRIARWRTTDPAQRAKALGVEKPAVQLSGQLDLLAEVAA